MKYGLYAVIAIALLEPVASGQAAYRAPRTPDGQPDIEGIWSRPYITPFERPAEFAGKEFFTEQEAVEYERQVAQRPNQDVRGKTAEEDLSDFNEFWVDRPTKLHKTGRTSLVLEPDGRVPPLTPEVQQRITAYREARRLHPADGPEDRRLTERCIAGAWPANRTMVQIVQAPGYVVILAEANLMDVSRTIVIPLDGRPHLPQSVRMWLGDPVGHWEGDTLVVETTNYSDETWQWDRVPLSGTNLRMIERYTRTGPDTLAWEVTTDDPATFTRPWRFQFLWEKSEGPIFEDGCHEGNYSLANILAGARAEERAAAKAAAKVPQ